MIAAALLLASSELLEIQIAQEGAELVVTGRCDIDVDGFLFFLEAHYGVVEPGRSVSRATAALTAGEFSLRLPIPGDPPFPGVYVFQITAPLSQPVEVPRHVLRDIRRYGRTVEYTVGTEADRDAAVQRVRSRLTEEVATLDESARRARAVFERAEPAPADWSMPLVECSMRMQAIEYRLTRLDGIAYEISEQLGGRARQMWQVAGEAAVLPEQFDAMAQDYERERQRLVTLLGSLAQGEVIEVLDELEGVLAQGPTSADSAAARRDALDLVLKLNYRAPGGYDRIQELAQCVGPIFDGDETTRAGPQARAAALIAELRDALTEDP